MPSSNPQPQPALDPERHQYKTLSVIFKSIIAAGLIAGVIGAGALFTSKTTLLAQSSGDHVSDSEQQARITSFNALGPLPLAIVPAASLVVALESMHLAPAAQAALQNELDTRDTSSAAVPVSAIRSGQQQAVQSAAPSQAVSSVPVKADASGHGNPATTPSVAPSVTTSPSPVAALSRSAPTRLAWITLWDSDVEDGDVVRIESAGYSRTVVLASKGATLAIPVPASGKVNITGVRDGDGGGITVGVASGAVQAVLPIMSVGQVLTLNVKVN